MENEKESKEDRGKIKKKTLLWLYLFPPYGIYLMAKHRAVKPIALLPIFLVFGMSSLLTYDAIKNPYGIQDNMAYKLAVNSEGDIGTVRDLDRVGSVEIKDRKYDKYSVYTTNGKFSLYFGSDDGKSYTLECIYEVEPERGYIYIRNESREAFGEFSPEVLEFLAQDTAKYGKNPS